MDFLTTCRQPHYGRYWIPYRSIYSRNVANLFVVGRCFSCSHVGLGGVRVINTLSQLGVAAGEAAAMCRERAIGPREIYTRGLCRTLVVDQAAGCGFWRDVGTFELAPGATLRLVGKESYGTVIADGFAVKEGAE